MVDAYLVSVIAFFVVLAFLIYKDRKNIQHKYYIFYKRETKSGLKLLDKAVNWSPLFWKIIGNLSVIVSVAAMALGIFYLVMTVVLILEGKLTEPGIRLLLPTPTAEPISGVGFIGIPFWFWVIAVALVMFPHELSHGVIARLEKVKVKSVGAFLLLIFPGAFVEPDERQFQRSKLMSKLRIIGAGTFANFVTALMLFLIASFIIWPQFVRPGVVITSVNQTAPAGIVGLEEGMVLQKLNGKEIAPSYSSFFGVYTTSLFANIKADQVKGITALHPVGLELSNYKPGDMIVLTVNDKEYRVMLDRHPANPDFPYIGVSSTLNSAAGSGIFDVLLPLITLSAYISLLVGIVNILPLYPLDGGVFVRSILDKFFKKKSVQLMNVVTFSMLALIAATIVLPIFLNLVR